MKKSLILTFLILIICILSKHLIFFEYFNPYTNTKPLRYIAPAIKELDKGFSYAKKSADLNGYKIKYLYFNAYGSGFIENNNIPNDLDYAIGIDLGKYNYNGKNSLEIAENIADKIGAFRSSFNFYYNSNFNIHTTIDTNFFTEQNNLNQNRKIITDNISQNIKNALSDKDYVNFTKKTIESDNNVLKEIEVPYIMKSHEILLENMPPIKLYSDLVQYNKNMPRYIREISIVPEYYITINADGENHKIELVPESFLGERLQMKRRLFTSCVFVHLKSVPFITKMDYINDDKSYLYFRNLSFKRHLQEINNIIATGERVFKLPKRLHQSADLISPIMIDGKYLTIKNYTGRFFADKSAVLLNEYSNIVSLIYDISLRPDEFLTLLKSGQIHIMMREMNNVLSHMQDSGIDKQNIALLQKNSDDLEKNILAIKDKNDINTFQTYLNHNIRDIKNNISISIPNNVLNVKEVIRIVGMFNKIYKDAGYNKVTLYWLSRNTIGIVENEFTKKIDDFSKFAKENNLLCAINYKLIKEEDTPELALRYDIFARYNSSEKENEKLAEINDKMLKDKKNFNLKYKIVFIK